MPTTPWTSQVLIKSPLSEIAAKKPVAKKASQSSGYDYYAIIVLQMTPEKNWMHCIFGDVASLDIQKKRKNLFGFMFCCPTGINGNKYIVQICHLLTFMEQDNWTLFILHSLSQISGQPLESIVLLSIDRKLEEEYFCFEIPSE